MEELVHHRYYNSGLQADSYVHMARARERRNWLMASLYYSLKQWMTGLVVGRTLVTENSRMEALQMLSKHH